MKKKNIIIFTISIIAILGILLFLVLHFEMKYVPFKTCNLGHLDIPENYNFQYKMIYVQSYCQAYCSFPQFLNNGVGENSQGYYCTYKSFF